MFNNQEDNVSFKEEQLSYYQRIAEKSRDFFQGVQKEILNKYLKKWGTENDDDFKVRLKTTNFVNYYSRLISSLVDLVLKKEPILEDVDFLDVKNITKESYDLNSFLKNVITNGLIDGLCFIGFENIKDKKETLRFKLFKYGELVNYILDDRGDLEQITFKERKKTKIGNFATKEIDYYKVYNLKSFSVYTEKDLTKPKKEIKNDCGFVPIIPLFFGKRVIGFNVIPPLIDILELQESLLHNSTLLTNLSLVISRPILSIFIGDNQNLDVRKNFENNHRRGFIFRNKQTDGVKFDEITGNGATFVQKEVDRIIEEIKRLSFNLFTISNVKTTTEAKSSQIKNSSILTSIVDELENKMETVLFYFKQIKGIKGDKGTIEFARDFDNLVISYEYINILLQMRNSGSITNETFLKILKTSGGLFHKDFDIDQENLKLETP